MYNNCFLLTGTAKTNDGKKIKKAMYIDKDGKVRTLFKWDPKNDRIIQENLQYYQMEYWRAEAMLEFYKTSGYRYHRGEHERTVNGTYTHGDDTLRISVWLEDAKWNDLHLLCIDFDKVGDAINETPFFKATLESADFVTRSQGGGYHCWFGIDKESATPLFEEINLTTHKNTKSFVCAIALTSNGDDKFDVFCCNGRLLHEHEPWQKDRGVTDKTQIVYELLKEHVEIKKKVEIDFWEDAEGKTIVLEGMPEETLREQMCPKQRAVLDDLSMKDAGCTREIWFWVGCNIKHVYGEELGGSVWLWWSKQGANYQKQACVNTWGEICRRKTMLRDYTWDQLMEFNILEKADKDFEEMTSKIQQKERNQELHQNQKEDDALRLEEARRRVGWII